MRAYFCIFRLLVHAIVAVIYGMVRFPFLNTQQKNQYVKDWSLKLMAISGVQIKIVNPELLSSRALIVANHVSWLDIFLIYSFISGHFIAKADMARWPIVGQLCKRTGTLFIDRNNVRDLKHILSAMSSNFKDHERCIFFPEGTTGRQGSMLPFHPNLFEGAIRANLPIQPFALRYLNKKGEFEQAVDSSGDISLVDSMKHVFNSDYVLAELTILPVIEVDESANRKLLAQRSRDEIEQFLLKTPGFHKTEQK